MGTRALVHFKEGSLTGPTIVSMYRQYDGYPEGWGKDMYDALNEGMVQILNGHQGQSPPTAFNGLSCLAAWLIGELKEGTIGNVYLYPPDSEDVGEEYTYTLYSDDDGELCMKVEGYTGELGRGLLKDFNLASEELFVGALPKDKEYEIDSESDSDVSYIVTHHVEKWTCECRDHIFRRHDCKHIKEAQGSF